MNNIIELSSERSFNGRKKIKMALLTIHNEGEHNDNDIHWDETYVTNNLDSLKGIPICAEFIDDTKEVPLDHGLTDIVINEDGNGYPLFEDSECVGMIEYGKIEECVINSKNVKVLMGYGHLYDQRYPKFTKWVSTNSKDETVTSSIEIMGTKSNKNKIVYEYAEDNSYRTPKIFDFTATAILSVKEADENAVVLEVASKKNQTKEDLSKMDEKQFKQLLDTVSATLMEVNSKNVADEETVAKLNGEIESKANEVTELNAKVEELTAKVAELAEQNTEKEAKIAELNSVIEGHKKEAKIAELNSALSAYKAEDVEVAKEAIEAFKADPINCGLEINSIVGQICTEIVKKQEEAKATLELNSAKNDTDDVYGLMEVNSTSEPSASELNEDCIY